MELMTLKEFKQKNQTNSIEEYFEYIKDCENKIISSIHDAEEMHLPKSIIKGLLNNLEIVKNVKKLLRDYSQNIMVHTISSMEEEKLKKLWSQELEDKKQEIKVLELAIHSAESIVNQAKNAFSKNLRSEGLDYRIYDDEDTAFFFQDFYSTEEYIESLLSAEEIDDLSLTSAIKKSIAFLTFGTIAEKELWQTAKYIVQNILKLRNIKDIGDMNVGELVSSFLGNININEIILDLSSESNIPFTLKDIFLGIQCNQKRKTRFFIYLDDDLKDLLCQERFQGDIYNNLLNYYRNYKNKTPIKIDIPQTISLGLLNIEALTNDLQNMQSFVDLNDGKKPDETELRTYFMNKAKEKFSTKGLVDNLKESTQEYANQRDKQISELQERINTLEEKAEKIKLLITPDMEKFLDITDKLLYWDSESGYIDSKEYYKHILKIEEIRMEMIDLMCTNLTALSELEKMIKDLTTGSLLSKITSPYRKEILEAVDLYQMTILKIYKGLCALSNEAPIKIKGYSTERVKKEISSFDDLNVTLLPLLEDYPKFNDDEEKAKEEGYIFGDDNIVKLFSEQKELFNLLFSFYKDSKKTYKIPKSSQKNAALLKGEIECYSFAILTNKGALERLQSIQRHIVKYLNLLYMYREENYKNMLHQKENIPETLGELSLLTNIYPNMLGKTSILNYLNSITEEVDRLRLEQKSCCSKYDNQIANLNYHFTLRNLDNALEYTRVLEGIESFSSDEKRGNSLFKQLMKK